MDKNDFKYVILDNIKIKNMQMKNMQLNKFIEIIFLNFEELSEIKELKHSKYEIFETIMKENSLFILCMNETLSKIIGYLIGYFIILNDQRKVFYISYIYVSKSHRNQNIGKTLLDICEKETLRNKHNGVLLTCDTTKQLVMDFYSKKGYMLDFNLRRYSRYDVYYKQI